MVADDRTCREPLDTVRVCEHQTRAPIWYHEASSSTLDTETLLRNCDQPNHIRIVHLTQSLDEFEDRHAGFDLGFEVMVVEQFAFESGKETLAHGVVEAIAHRTHRRPHTCRRTALAKGQRSILGEFKQSSQHFE